MYNTRLDALGARSMSARGATEPSSNTMPTPPSHQQAPSAAGDRPATPIVATPVATATDETSIDRHVVGALVHERRLLPV